MTDDPNHPAETTLTYEICAEVEVPVASADDLTPPNQIAAIEEATRAGRLRLKGYEPADPDHASAIRDWFVRRALPDGLPRKGEVATIRYRAEDGEMAAVTATLLSRSDPEQVGWYELVFEAETVNPPATASDTRIFYTVTVPEGAETVRYEDDETAAGAPVKELRTESDTWTPVDAADETVTRQRASDIQTLGEFRGISGVERLPENPPQPDTRPVEEPPAPPAETGVE
jgi:hypothetical protein